MTKSKVLKDLEDYIKDFNDNNDLKLSYDTIRIDFSKQHKLIKIKALGNWKKISKSNRTIFSSLRKKIIDDEVTSVYQLENYNIFYYNSNKDKPRYRLATMVIFGLKQYHKEPTPHHIIENLLSILKNITSLDLCCDMKQKPNIDNLKGKFRTRQYLTKEKVKTDTHYINNTNILMLDRVCIYNKAKKNDLKGRLYRIEATISIPNIKALALPLYEFKHIIELLVTFDNKNTRPRDTV
ncbi:hypothetical protein N5U26_00145 [Aliarcobacter cryaerophilus]|uniref:hypothetical protein n=1 Tax=Aliarcobacter cryaerophilus TaxID=28198 RepID=UPI0021B65301|nr:hypothetical protein [Aliarcobacter cryaerophilus]MCT7508760.1 hypothetical protein [Aliarcobacter cryaerophilus]